MIIHVQEFDNESSALSVLQDAQSATGTHYTIGSDCRTLKDFVAWFNQVQFGRSFTPGYSCIDLCLVFDQKDFYFRYVSTSDTQIELRARFDWDMSAKWLEIEVNLPDERVGGHHYNTLTRALQRYEWTREIQRTGARAIAKGDGTGNPLPVPTWALEKVSNFSAIDHPERVSKFFARYGFEKFDAIGFRQGWKHEDGRFIIQAKFQYGINAFAMLTAGEAAPSRAEEWRSYREICQKLTKPPKPACPQDDLEPDEEDYDYDEDYKEDDYEGCE